MRKISITLLFVTAVAVFSCKKEVNITVPKIITLTPEPSSLDTICQVVIAEAEIESNRLILNYSWTVKDGENNAVPLLRTNKDSVWWIPKKEGDYRVEATATSYNKRVKTIEVVKVRNGVRFYRKAIVGKWEGVATTPWIPPYTVEIEFFADGHYSAKCTDGTAVALYYGTDDDSPLKTYAINTVNEEGAAGEIEVLFDVTFTTTTDQLRRIKFSGTDSLHFEKYHLSVGDPVIYDLKKQ